MYKALKPRRSAIFAENISNTPGATMNSPAASSDLSAAAMVLPGIGAVVDVEYRPVDDRGACRAEPQDRRSDFLGPAGAASIDLLQQLLAPRGVHHGEQLGLDRARRHRVHLDAVPAEVAREAARHAGDAGLGDAVPEVGMRLVGGDRGEIDDARGLARAHLRRH